MIIQNTGRNFLGIPTIIKEEKNCITGEPIDLPPGYTEVDDAAWAIARTDSVLRLIASGRIKEEWVKRDLTETKDCTLVIPSDKETETTKRLVPAKLSDIDRKGNKIIEVVKHTYDLKTLRNWYATELRQDVRVELQTQIKNVEEGVIKE